MALYCSPAIFKALSGLDFPASKEEILSYAMENRDAPEAAVVALNQLQDKVVYADIGAICENVKITCSLEIFRSLEGLAFPANKEKIISFARSKGASESTIMALDELPQNYDFRSIREICENVT